MDRDRRTFAAGSSHPGIRAVRPHEHEWELVADGERPIELACPRCEVDPLVVAGPTDVVLTQEEAATVHAYIMGDHFTAEGVDAVMKKLIPAFERSLADDAEDDDLETPVEP